MEEVKKCKRTDLRTTLKISIKIKNISQDLMKLINFIQLNRLALKQLLRNVDDESHAFESQLFKDFFQGFYNEKNSHLKHFLEHPGILRVYFQLEYLINVMELGLNETIKKKDYIIDESLKTKNDLFSYNIEMEEINHQGKNKMIAMDDSNVRDFATNPHNNVEEENHAEAGNQHKIILRNYEAARNFLKLQKHFFKIHKNNMFKQLGIDVHEYYDVDVLNNAAYQNYTTTNLTKEEFIYINLKFQLDNKPKDEKHCYSMLDLTLVYLHTFLYLLNYYGLAQTSPSYTTYLNQNATTSGVLQAASPLGAIFFGFIINCITKKKYKFPYLLCLAMLFIGNFCYYIAASFTDKNLGVVMLVIGRVIFGSGGSRLMTRKFIAINVPSQYQSKYSTYLVGFSALGITLGPGLSSVLEFVKPTTIFSSELWTFNILSLVFFFVWLFLFFFFAILFKGYDISVEREYKKLEEAEKNLEKKFLNLKIYYNNLKSDQMNDNLNLNLVGKKHGNFMVSGLIQNSGFNQANHHNKDQFQAIKPKYTPKKPSRMSVIFPNDITFYSLWCFLIFKIIQEAYFTEQPIMLKIYYGFSSQFVGWFMLSLTLVGVPTALITGWATKKYEDRKILLIGFIFYIIGTIGKINYDVYSAMPKVQYFGFSTILFIASLIGESAAISILAKVISPSLKLGFLNAGLLSGTADTLGRALGNSSMTLFSSFR